MCKKGWNFSIQYKVQAYTRRGKECVYMQYEIAKYRKIEIQKCYYYYSMQYSLVICGYDVSVI